MLLYSLLHLTGYDLPMVELKKFRQVHSKTPGHPECFATPGVEVCTGPLGQGISNAVGMAVAFCRNAKLLKIMGVLGTATMLVILIWTLVNVGKSDAKLRGQN